ncbi:MAG: small multi-drug export protein [Clostridia bacterium]|nr:small multi-drug export protein [Clostridia bacterium]
MSFLTAFAEDSAAQTTGAVTTTTTGTDAEAEDDSLAARVARWLEGKGIPQWLIPFIISVCPILELRGGIVAARIVGMELIPAFLICFVGNMLPIPFVLLFIKKIFAFFRDKKFFGKIVQKLEARAESKSKGFKKGELIGLFLFVAIPLPGTGAWTGALVASLLNMPVKKSLPIITVGVLVAGFIMSLLMYGVLGSAF